MSVTRASIDVLQKFGVGRRSLDDELFRADKGPMRLGIYDEDPEDSCTQIASSACTVPGCAFRGQSLRLLEQHYGAAHRYRCGTCRRALPSPHLLDLHVQEIHDSFFAVAAARRPSYCCYIQECTERFMNAEERSDHCIRVHKLPKDFRFEIKPKSGSEPKRNSTSQTVTPMEVEGPRSLVFHNGKRKGLIQYSGKKFTSDRNKLSSVTTDIDQIMLDFKENLPK